eukprot:1794022-Pleurochrysis_carterae.AAC.1
MWARAGMRAPSGRAVSQQTRKERGSDRRLFPRSHVQEKGVWKKQKKVRGVGGASSWRTACIRDRAG